MTFWRRLVRKPQTLLLRKALFQVHLWAGIGVGLYIFVICISGSVLVYRNELYRRFSPRPVIVTGSGVTLADEALTTAVQTAFPEYAIAGIRRGETANHAVEITLKRGERTTRRLFHPFTGEDLGDPLPLGYRVTRWILDFHDNLLGGQTGRRVNGVGAILVLVLCVTGAAIWWPGIKSWRRSLIVPLKASATRVIWSLHSALGFWFFGFMLMWAITGMYLCFPETFAAMFDYLEPFDENNPAERLGDRIQYWLAYLHFGRLGNRGIPGCGRQLCEPITKATWAVAGLVPPIMFVTGALMWWSRVVKPAVHKVHWVHRVHRVHGVHEVHRVHEVQKTEN
jgi:uncharacterized iron-regulated membrane protein